MHIKDRKRKRSQLVDQRRLTGRSLGAILAFLLLLCTSVATLLIAWQYSLITRDIPPIEKLETILNPETGIFSHPTRLMDNSGTQLLAELSIPGVERRYVGININQLEHISEDLINAVVAATQPDFWESPGFSLRSFNPEDHSTIAQRLVFSLLLSNEPPSIKRSIREKLLASQVIARYGHQQVLEWYMNSTPFGNYAYGVETASRTYLGKSSTVLTLPEATLIAGVSLAPALNPWDSAAGAKALQQEVLKQMAIEKMITTEIFRTALQVPLAVTPPVTGVDLQWSAFTREAIGQLKTELGSNVVERGGLLAQTTLDTEAQTEADCVLQASNLALYHNQAELQSVERNCPTARLLPVLPPMEPVPADGLRSAALTMDPKTGQVLAYADTGQGARLTNLPAGSLITPFVYLNSFTQGFSPATMVWDAPASMDGEELQENQSEYHGPVSIRTALANDYLLPAESVFTQTGSSSFTRLLGSFGVSSDVQVKAEDLLSGILVSPVEIAGSYAILANSGMKSGAYSLSDPGTVINPVFLINVWDSQGEKLLDWSEKAEQPIISAQLAYLVNHILSDDLARAPSLGYPNILQIGSTTASKMGKTITGEHAWTVGYQPDRLIVAWTGKNKSIDPKLQVDPRWTAGIWRALMQSVATDLPQTAWLQPDGMVQVNVCDPSGMLPTADCPKTIPEVFISGNEPVQTDTLYQRFPVNYETGKLATVFTPREMVTEKVFMVIPEEYRSWASASGLPLPPDTYDAVKLDLDNPAVHISSPDMFDIVSGEVTITGTASSQGFQSYRIEAGQGLNPLRWIQIGSTGDKPVIEDALALWDTTGLNGLYALRLQVVGEDNRLQTSTIQVTLDNTPPEVSIKTSAEPNLISMEKNPVILISADIQDQTGIKEVVILMDGTEISKLDQPPFGYLWTTSPGKHTFQVKATDLAGNSSVSQELILDIVE